MKQLFRRVATRISNWAGSAIVFLGAIVVVLVWAASGPLFHFSDTWQLVINTGTTIITFLMVFLIQNTQNRDGKAVQLKLDELIHATKGARTHFVGLEDLSDEEIAALDSEFKRMANNGNTVKALVRLHEKIELERKRRMTLTEAGTVVLQKLHLTPQPVESTPTKPPTERL